MCIRDRPTDPLLYLVTPGLHRTWHALAVGESTRQAPFQPRTGTGSHPDADDPLVGDVLHRGEPLYTWKSLRCPFAGGETAAEGLFLQWKALIKNISKVQAQKLTFTSQTIYSRSIQVFQNSITIWISYNHIAQNISRDDSNYKIGKINPKRQVFGKNAAHKNNRELRKVTYYRTFSHIRCTFGIYIDFGN